MRTAKGGWATQIVLFIGQMVLLTLLVREAEARMILAPPGRMSGQWLDFLRCD